MDWGKGLIFVLSLLLAWIWPLLGGADKQIQPRFSDQAIRKAQAYLHAQYEPDVGLLRCSTIVAPNQFWLATDNLLASWALEDFDIPARYGEVRHGLLEVLRGETVEWPPHTHHHFLVQKSGDLEVWRETRISGEVIQNWREYADLVMLGALNYHNAGRIDLARQTFANAMTMFDGYGFADRAKADGHGFYATFKLALALDIGEKLGVAIPEKIPELLLQKQAQSGGFHTLYDKEGVVGDTGTETTAFAILAMV